MQLAWTSEWDWEGTVINAVGTGACDDGRSRITIAWLMGAIKTEDTTCASCTPDLSSSLNSCSSSIPTMTIKAHRSLLYECIPHHNAVGLYSVASAPFIFLLTSAIPLSRTDCDIQETLKLWNLKLLHFKIPSFYILWFIIFWLSVCY